MPPSASIVFLFLFLTFSVSAAPAAPAAMSDDGYAKRDLEYVTNAKIVMREHHEHPAKHDDHPEKNHHDQHDKHGDNHDISHDHLEKTSKYTKESSKHDGKSHKGSSSIGYPFKRVVAFGDNLSDNGNGSYAHGVAKIGQPHNKIYGYKTWTDGPVAVSYLVDLLGVPLAIDYAFGGAQGGSKLGATINSSYTYSEYAPDGFTQVHNYTHTSGYTQHDAAETLHFVWIGNNDINLLHISTAIHRNGEFAEAMSRQMVELVGRLIRFGAQHIFVPGLYPKQLSPSWKFFASNTTERHNLGSAIRQANAAIKSSLEKSYGDKVIYYDVFGFMKHVWDHHDAYGITHTGPGYCDGYSQKDWNLCVTEHKGYEFYWMQFLDMTTRVHSLVAKDMNRVLKIKFGV